MKMTKKKLFILLGVLCLVVCIALVIVIALPKRDEIDLGNVGPSRDTSSSSSDESSKATSSADHSSQDNSSEDSSVSEETSEPEPYVSPVDFETLWERCGDIYAWIDIPGADISYPIAQHPTDDSFYLYRNIDGKSDKNGTLYTERKYNTTTFSDPVTLIYGHNMRSGAMFGFLQEQFSDPEFFEENQEIIIYMPERELHYRVFAAVSYSTKHIMYKYSSFRESSALTEFLNEVYTLRGFGNLYHEDNKPTGEEDHVVVLSTCLPVSANGRYLVLGKLETVIGEPMEEPDIA